MASSRYNTALTYLEAFNSLSAETFASLFMTNFIHTFAPASCSPPPPLNKDEFPAHIKTLREVLEAFPVTAQDIMEDEKSNRVIIYATSETKFHDRVKDDGIPPEEWVYKGEYVFILTMDATGTKIERAFEFLDSKGTERLRGLMKRARENL